MIETAESKPKGDGFVCKKGLCASRAQEKGETSIFVPDQTRKTAKSRLPAKRAVNNLTLEEAVDMLPGERCPQSKARVGRMTAVPMSSRPIKMLVDDDELELKALNAEIVADEALQKLVASRAESGVRMKSKLHLGYALQKERETEQSLQALPRKLDKLAGMGKPRTIRGQYLAADPSFAVHDVEFGEPLFRKRKAEMEIYGSTMAKYLKTGSDTKASISEDSEDEPVDLPLDTEEGSTKLPREEEDYGDEEPEEDADADELAGIRADGSYFEIELHCVCNRPADEEMQQCQQCESFFHPECLGFKVDFFERCNACEQTRLMHQQRAQRSFGKDRSILSQIREDQKKAQQRRKTEMEVFNTKGAVAKRVKETQEAKAKQRRLKAAIGQIAAGFLET